MLRTQGIAHFTLPVSNLERSKKFYTEILGLELVRAAGPHLVFLRSGKDSVVLAQTDDAAKPQDAGAGTGQGTSEVHHAFIVEHRDFEASVEELKLAGVNVFEQDERGPGSVFNGRSAYFYDPDGNILEIIDLAATAFRHVAAPG
jgi:catechol 2,3-dioxygenase-like lactoylglutathione lyase family enzyme